MMCAAHSLSIAVTNPFSPMNRLLSLTLLFILSVAACAQERYVTHFLGIPVDGSKAEMLRKLREKGFRPSAIGDLEGEFNGRDVHLSVVTKRDRVWRILVKDATPSSKTGIIIRFNRLCHQFQDNPKYMSFRDDQTISDDEDVSYEITVHDKRYEAAFYQNYPTVLDTAQLYEKLTPLLAERFSEDEIANMTEDERDTLVSLMVKYYDLTLRADALKRSVWFMIDKDRYSSSYFRILMFYDNEFNSGDDGSDL